jgi:serine/threonine protein phosphatase 1
MLRRQRHRKKLLPESHRGEELAACFVVSRECSAFGALQTAQTAVQRHALNYQILVPAWRKEQKTMSKTYAIADLHGRFDLLEIALARITERVEPPATVVTLGDYVDRGPDSRKIIERLMAGLGRDGWRLICLKGNHEDIMWQTCRRLPDVDWWLTNGGGATLISYGQQEGDQVDVTIVPTPHLDWIEQLPLMYVDRHRVFVHAGIDPNCPLDEQDAETVMWKIYPDDDDGGYGQHHVVHGHHQHAHGPIFKKNRTNLDTFAWYTGRLAIGVFDDARPGGPIEVLEVNGEPIEKRLQADGLCRLLT